MSHQLITIFTGFSISPTNPIGRTINLYNNCWKIINSRVSQRFSHWGKVKLRSKALGRANSLFLREWQREKLRKDWLHSPRKFPKKRQDKVKLYQTQSKKDHLRWGWEGWEECDHGQQRHRQDGLRGDAPHRAGQERKHPGFWPWSWHECWHN